MAMARLPVLYLSHGSPVSGFTQNEDSDFWKRLGKQVLKLDGLRAILLVSGHWEERPVRVNTTSTPQTIYDFYGFPREFYTYKYPGKGAPEVANRLLQLLYNNNVSAVGDPDHGLDHGSWVPLKWMLPGGEVPVLQLSLLDGGSMEDHIALGKTLRPLRDEGVLIVASGTAVHNLRDMGRFYNRRTVADYVAPFDKALEMAVVEPKDFKEREKRLLDLQHNPLLRKAHPSLEHLLPIHVAGGAAGDDTARKVFHKHEMSFSSASFLFGDGISI